MKAPTCKRCWTAHFSTQPCPGMGGKPLDPFKNVMVKPGRLIDPNDDDPRPPDVYMTARILDEVLTANAGALQCIGRQLPGLGRGLVAQQHRDMVE